MSALRGQSVNKVNPDFTFRIMNGTSTDRVLAVRFPELARRIDQAESAGNSPTASASASSVFDGRAWTSWPGQPSVALAGTATKPATGMKCRRRGGVTGKANLCRSLGALAERCLEVADGASLRRRPFEQRRHGCRDDRHSPVAPIPRPYGGKGLPGDDDPGRSTARAAQV